MYRFLRTVRSQYIFVRQRLEVLLLAFISLDVICCC
jgi:hypothetical protein